MAPYWAASCNFICDKSWPSYPINRMAMPSKIDVFNTCQVLKDVAADEADTAGRKVCIASPQVTFSIDAKVLSIPSQETWQACSERILQQA
jgi:hypothetical protein